MPGAWAHSHYWSGGAAVAAADPSLGTSAGGAYVPWQIAILSRLGLGWAPLWAVWR